MCRIIVIHDPSPKGLPTRECFLNRVLKTFLQTFQSFRWQDANDPSSTLPLRADFGANTQARWEVSPHWKKMCFDGNCFGHKPEIMHLLWMLVKRVAFWNIIYTFDHIKNAQYTRSWNRRFSPTRAHFTTERESAYTTPTSWISTCFKLRCDERVIQHFTIKHIGF